VQRRDRAAVAFFGELLDAGAVGCDEGELTGDEERVGEDQCEDCEQPRGAVYG
jgi:hypothetical protein